MADNEKDKKKKASDVRRKRQLQNQESSGLSSMLGTAVASGAAGVLFARSGMRVKFSNTLNKFNLARKNLRSKGGLFNDSSVKYYTADIDNWKTALNRVKEYWKDASDTIKRTPIRLDPDKNNTAMGAIRTWDQMQKDATMYAERAWNAHLARKGREYTRERLKNTNLDANTAGHIDDVIAHMSHNIDNNVEFHKIAFSEKTGHGLKGDAAALAQDIIKKMREENMAMSKINPKSTARSEFIKAHAEKYKTTIAEKQSDWKALEEYSRRGADSFTDKLNGDRAATIKEIVEYADRVRKNSTASRSKYGNEFITENIDTLELIKKAREDAAIKGQEDNFLNIILDEDIRINSKGELYSTEGYSALKDEFLQGFARTIPGKILKTRDMIFKNKQPMFFESLKGTFDPVLAAATNVENKKTSELENTVYHIYGKSYKGVTKVDEEGIESFELEEIKNLKNYHLVSGHFGATTKQLRMMAGEGRKVISSNPILNTFDLLQDRDSFNGKTPWERLTAMFGKKDVNETGTFINTLIKPTFESESAFINETRNLFNKNSQSQDGVREGVEYMLRIADMHGFMNDNTYQLSTNAVRALKKKAEDNGNERALEILNILDSSNDENIESDLMALGEKISDFESEFNHSELKRIVRKLQTDPAALHREVHQVTTPNHVRMSSTPGFGVGKESLSTEDYIRKNLGMEAILRLTEETNPAGKLEVNTEKLSEVLKDLNLSELEQHRTQNLASTAILPFAIKTNIATENVLDKKSLADTVLETHNFFTNDKGETSEIVRNSLAEIKNENLTGFETYYKGADPVSNGPTYNEYIYLHNSTEIEDIFSAPTDEKWDRIKHLVGQMFAGRDNLEDVSEATLAPFFMLTRLNEVGEMFGIGFSDQSMKSTASLAANIMLKRVLPVTVGATYLEWGDDTVEELTGQSPIGAVARGAANVDIAARGVLDTLGLTDWLKEEKEINPIMQYLWGHETFQNADERADYYRNGYDPVRKGAWWIFGSVNELRGGEIQYWRPNAVRLINSDYKDKSLYDGYFDKWSHSLLPTPTNPLSPIFGLFDPYWLERKHEDDRPYPISGNMFDDGTPTGIILNTLIGDNIKPQKELHPWRFRNGVDIYNILNEANDYIRQKAADIGERNYFIINGQDVEPVRFNAWNAITEDDSVQSIVFKNGINLGSVEQTYGVYEGAGRIDEDGVPVSNGSNRIYGSGEPGEGLVIAGDGGNALGSVGVNYDTAIRNSLKNIGFTPLTDDNFSQILSYLPEDKNHAIVEDANGNLGVLSADGEKTLAKPKNHIPLHDILIMDAEINGDFGHIKKSMAQLLESPLNLIEKLNKDAREPLLKKHMTGAEFDDEEGFLMPDKLKQSRPSQGMELLQDSDTIAELLNEGKGSDLVHSAAVSARLLTGIYGYAAGAAMGIGTDQEKRLATSQDMTSFSRTFWDSNIGGAGGSTMEIIRRFIPDFRRGNRVNPLMNEMPDWLPDRFKMGDPYTSIPLGEARLPGKGYESLNELHSDAYGEYGAFDRFKILADVAPFSPEYKIWKKVAEKTVTDPALIEEMADIKERVSQQGRKHDFYDYKILNKDIEYKEIVVSDVLDHGKFKSGNIIYKIAGISVAGNENESVSDVMNRYIKAGDTITVAVDTNYDEGVNRDNYKSINAAVYKDGVNIGQQMLENGDARKRKGDTSSAAVLTNYSVGQKAIAAASELIAHADVPWLSDQFLRVRSPLEAYKAEEVYGTPYQSWEHPIDTFLMPAITRSFHERSALDSVGTMIFNEAINKPNLSKMGKFGIVSAYALSNRGAFIGAALANFVDFGGGKAEHFARVGSAVAEVGHALTGFNGDMDALTSGADLGYSIARLLKKSKGKGAVIGALLGELKYDIDGRKPWHPKEAQEKWEMQDYFDRLTHIKYQGLYEEAARRAKEEEDVDVAELIKKKEEDFAETQEALERFKNLKKNLHMSNKLDIIQALNEKIKALENRKEIFEGGEWTRTALIYKQAADATMAALDENSSWAQIITALPTNEREFFMEFVKERDEDKRNEIFEMVSPSLQKALALAWKRPLPKEEDNASFFANHELPDSDWEGWQPDTDLKDIEVKTIQNEGMNLSDFGFYESQLRDPDVIDAVPMDFRNNSDNFVTIRKNLLTTLKGYGLKNVDISIGPGANGTQIMASIKTWLGIGEQQKKIDEYVKYNM